MNNRTKTIFSLSVLLAASAFAADKAAIQAQYAAMAKAFQTKNVPGVLGITTPDVVLVDESGKKSGRKEIESEYRAMLGFVKKFESVKIEMLSAKVAGATAQCKSRSTIQAVIPVPQTDSNGKTVLKDGKPMMRDGRLRAVNESSDTWALVDGVWKLKMSKVDKTSTWLDGKKVG